MSTIKATKLNVTIYNYLLLQVPQKRNGSSFRPLNTTLQDKKKQRSMKKNSDLVHYSCVTFIDYGNKVKAIRRMYHSEWMPRIINVIIN